MNTRTITTSATIYLPAGNQINYSWTTLSGTEVRVETFRSNKFSGPEDEGYRPSAIYVDSTKVWEYRTSGMRLAVEMIWVEGDECPYIIERNSMYLFQVLPTQDFEVAQFVLVNGMTKLFGGSSIEQLLDQKISLAGGLDLEPDFTAAEQDILNQRREQARKVREAQQAAQAEQKNNERLARMAARESFRHNLKNRMTMVAYTATGDIRSGIPITEEEIPRLIENNHYIVTDETGEPARYFFLNQVKQQRGTTEVSSKKPELKATAVVTAPNAENTILVPCDGAAIEAPLYRDMGVLSEARKYWRNPIVAAHYEVVKGVRTGRICVVRASSKQCEGVGVVTPPPQPIAA